ncbi:MAG: YIP1 family protein, partial [Thermodesulfovibrionales bacterium]
MSEEVRFTKVIFDDAIKVIKNPVEFYKEMSRTGGFGRPVLFLAFMTLLGFLVLLIGKALIVRPFDFVGGLIMVIVIPTIIVVASFAGAAILFGIWKILGSEEKYETAYRCMAYVCAVLP